LFLRYFAIIIGKYKKIHQKTLAMVLGNFT
jgi:hypothetical protein